MTKPKQVRIYIHGEDGPYIEELAAKFHLAETSVLTMLVGAGLAAIRANGNRFELPLELRIGAPLEPPGISPTRGLKSARA